MGPEIEINNNANGYLVTPETIKPLIEDVLINEEMHASHVCVVFINDDEMARLHANFLDDDSPTDIMTFDLGEEGLLDCELYISLDRAAEHADRFDVTLPHEAARLIVHGLLHLNGYDDHTEAEQQQMRDRENFYLQRFVNRLPGIKQLSA